MNTLRFETKEVKQVEVLTTDCNNY